MIQNLFRSAALAAFCAASLAASATAAAAGPAAPVASGPVADSSATPPAEEELTREERMQMHETRTRNIITRRRLERAAQGGNLTPPAIAELSLHDIFEQKAIELGRTLTLEERLEISRAHKDAQPPRPETPRQVGIEWIQFITGEFRSDDVVDVQIAEVFARFLESQPEQPSEARRQGLSELEEHVRLITTTADMMRERWSSSEFPILTQKLRVYRQTPQRLSTRTLTSDEERILEDLAEQAREKLTASDVGSPVAVDSTELEALLLTSSAPAEILALGLPVESPPE